jgi:hypothetical protein
MREALEQWSALLKRIVDQTTTPDNVVALKRA